MTVEFGIAPLRRYYLPQAIRVVSTCRYQMG